MNQILTYEEAKEIYRAIQTCEDRRDPDIAGLYDDLYCRAIRYAHFRAEWNTLTREEKQDTDSSRTSAHDAFITSINIIARLQAEAGMKWRERLGDDRKRIGDFACYLALFLGIEAR